MRSKTFSINWKNSFIYLFSFKPRNADSFQTNGGGKGQGHDSVDELTSSRPPLDGADGGRVQDELLGGWIEGGGGLQASEVSS